MTTYTDNRPIGIFDSGLGGLTIVKEIQHSFPQESILYVGDTARVPYGNRSIDIITQFSQEIVTFLLRHDVKAIIIACASASSAASAVLRLHYPQIPILDVISPFAKTLHLKNSHCRIGLIGTRATIQSGLLAKTIQNASPDAVIQTQACPLFVPIIEEGIVNGDILNQTIKLYLGEWISEPPDYLVLGCTHYPLITDALQTLLPNTEIIHPGVILAESMQQLIQTGTIKPSDSAIHHTYCVTDINESFQKLASLFLGSTITIEKTNLTE